MKLGGFRPFDFNRVAKESSSLAFDEFCIVLSLKLKLEISGHPARAPSSALGRNYKVPSLQRDLVPADVGKCQR